MVSWCVRESLSSVLGFGRMGREESVKYFVMDRSVEETEETTVKKADKKLKIGCLLWLPQQEV